MGICLPSPSSRYLLRGVCKKGDLDLSRLKPFFLCIFILLLAPAGGHAQQPVSSPKVQQLLQLLGDKDVQDWLETTKAAQPTAKKATARADAGAFLSGRLQDIRVHLQALVRAVPQVPRALADAGARLRDNAAGYGFFSIVLLAAGFVLLGLAVQWLFRRAAGGLRAPASAATAATPAARAGAHFSRLLVGLGNVAAFAAGSLGGFLLFQWPDMLRTVVVTFLLAALAVMVAHTLLAILFGPPEAAAGEDTDERLLPMPDDTAHHFRHRLILAIGWFAFGDAFVQVLKLLAVDRDVVHLAAYILGLGLVAIGIEAVWRRPGAQLAQAAGQAAADATTARQSWLYTAVFAALWLLWVAGTMRVFWLLVVATALPLVISWSRRAVSHLFRRAPEGEGEIAASDLLGVTVERVIRAALILAAIWVLSWAWGIGIHSLTDSDSGLTKIVRGLLSALIILLAADLAWQLTKTLVDTFLLRAADPGEPGSEEAIRHAKMRTLLPIVRNLAMVFLATLAVLMALSSLGVQIGPLIASAGVAGVAIGFGAQTVVKDVISGMFYLFDDAFRVGEYIVAGEYMGTVESFSLRSVRLRHHNGPVYTIPFGELGAIQNMSRDYAIDKFRLTVTYDSDLDKARKLIKKIGLELMEDPELAGSIIEPMKMQRVDNFGDYGIVLKVKMKTKPGEQFQVRKVAFPLIKKAFDENGIGFAFPTVKVAEGDSDSKPAVAQQALSIEAQKAAQ